MHAGDAGAGGPSATKRGARAKSGYITALFVSASFTSTAVSAGSVSLPAPELLAPAGHWECARAAQANGADAIYFGLQAFNARLRAENFTEEDLPELMAFLHQHGMRGFVTMNTLVFTHELEAAARQLRVLEEAGVDAIIVQDIGLARLAREVAPRLELHASTQMTITSPEGLRFVARHLGLDRAVLARELSLRELAKFRATEPGAVPLEVFVHGALCVAYSGQCLTSEALGQRSANRGECAQACRMPYQIVVDGQLRDLGDQRYLLSPQDLAAVSEIPALLRLGVRSFKIEGRLKSPEYVAAVTRVYRRALDEAMAQLAKEGEVAPVLPVAGALAKEDRYALEMAFSRGLYSGWLHGVNHQELVHARYGKKRGAYLGTVARTGPNFVEIRREPGVPLAAGDGVVFENPADTENEIGGRILELRGSRLLFDRRARVEPQRVQPGTRVFKTDDPRLNAELRRTWAGTGHQPGRVPLRLRLEGGVDEPLRVIARAEFPQGPSETRVESSLPLQAAQRRPLTAEQVSQHMARLGGTPFHLAEVDFAVTGEVILPVSELNRLRRAVVAALSPPRGERPAATGATSWRERLAAQRCKETEAKASAPVALTVLCRSLEQLEVVLATEGVERVYVDFEDIRRYRDAVALARSRPARVPVFLATPRIQKAGEEGYFKLIERVEPDGVLIRNLGAIAWFAGRMGLPAVGDFSLNVANPLTAEFFMSQGLERLTVSYDLAIGQVLDLLHEVPPEWFEITLHQHMPMFHMEHCVFAAFLSEGTDYTNCGRPCERHRVQLRDRVGQLHPLLADVGCRNTLFRGQAQTGARFFRELCVAGARRFRVELLREEAAETRRILAAYQRLLAGRAAGEQLWKELNATSRLGVTEGTLAKG